MGEVVDTVSLRKSTRIARAIMLACCVGLVPLQASLASTNDLTEEYDAALDIETQGGDEFGGDEFGDDFADHFAEIVPPIDTDFSATDLTVPQSAVDLSTFEPPRGPSVVRGLGGGIASYYGRRFHGRLTANGERFNMNAMTAAHKTLPFGTRVRVTNARNGRSVVVRINDRGPFIKGRTIDLSRGAAKEIGMISRGHANVELDIIE